MRCLILMTASVMLLTTVAVAPASARSGRQKPEQSWDNLKKLRVGEEIQVVYQPEQYLNGKFLGFTPQGISVQWGVVNLHKETIPRKDVIRVIASRPSQRLKNTLSGLGGGALAGLAIGWDAANSESGAAVVFFPAGGAVIGAVAGALSSPDATIYEALQQDVRAELQVRPAAEPLQALSPERSWDNLRTLRIFQKVRVLDQSMESRDGKFLSVSDQAISFDAGRGEVTIRRADVLEVKAVRSQAGGQSGSGVWADLVTVYRAELWGNPGSWRGGSVSGEPACCCSSETPRLGDCAEREYGRGTTKIKAARRERKPKRSGGSRKAEVVLTPAPVPDSEATEVPTQSEETENPAEQPQPETEVSESSTPDSAEPPAAETPADPEPVETENPPSEEAGGTATEGR